MPSPLPDDVRIALAGGQKVEAIRLLREHTGLGLAEAMAAVESGLIPSAAPRYGFADPLPADVGAALAAGNKLRAIKLLRQAKGLNLKQAKAIADEASRMAGQQGKRHPDGLSPGEVPRSRLSLGLVAFVLLVLAAVVWLAAGRA